MICKPCLYEHCHGCIGKACVCYRVGKRFNLGNHYRTGRDMTEDIEDSGHDEVNWRLQDQLDERDREHDRMFAGGRND